MTCLSSILQIPDCIYKLTRLTSPVTEASLARVGVLKCSNNGGYGVWTQGNGANAGEFRGVDCVNNDGWGIGDQSFLGNNWFATHMSGNGLGAHRLGVVGGATNLSILYGGYSEGAQPNICISPAMVLGGDYGHRFDAHPDTNGLVFLGNESSNLLVTNYKGTDPLWLEFGTNTSAMVSFGRRVLNIDSPFGTQERYIAGRWSTVWANSTGRLSHSITSATSLPGPGYFCVPRLV